MKHFFEKYPLHSFLILPYLAIFLYAKNAHYLSFDMIYRPLIVSVFISSIFLTFSYFILSKNITRAGIWTSFVLFLLANYGFIYDHLELLYYKNLWPFSNIHRYLILVYVVLIIVSYLFTKFSKYFFLNLTRLLNLLFIFLIIFNLLFITVNPYESAYKAKSIKCSESKKIDKIIKKPDVYYFILDGFANRTTLEKLYNIRFDTFYNFLQTKGFYIANESFANYYFTGNSLASTLNMNYLENNKLFSISNNLVFKVFKSLGYKIIHINSGYTVSRNFVCADYELNNEIINDYERAILKNTIFRLDDLVGIIPYFQIKGQLKSINEVLGNNEKPKFVFAHIVCPHPPYVFDKNGNLKPTNSFENSNWEPPNAYVEQLQYIGNEMIKIIQDILDSYKNSEHKPIIVLQSDHGPFFRHHDPEVIKYSRVHILNALYLSNQNYLYSNISSVNTFRYIFRYEFGLNINLVKDSMAGLSDLLKNRNFRDRKIE